MSWYRGLAIGFALGVALGFSACAPLPSQPGNSGGPTQTTSYAQSDSQSSNESSAKVPDLPLQSSSEAKGSLDPHKLTAGDVLSSEQIARGGGEEALFYNEPISDEVFLRMRGLSFGEDCTVPREDLRYVRVLHVDADGVTHVGELVVNRLVADEVTEIFRELYDAKYPIRKMRLVDDYGADDAASCSDDNTSAFNFRTIAGTSMLSNHAWGLAIDINTFENPYYIVSTGHLWPPEAERYLDRSVDDPYVLHVGDACYDAFVSRGWTWGGDWPDTRDYQHFEKPWVLE